MKKIYLLRHAQALPADGIKDIKRTLSPNGMQDAKALGKYMLKKEYKPDFILCSPSTRTRQTCENVMQSIGETKKEYPEILYNGSAGDILNLIQNVNDDYNSVLVVAHIPGIFEIAVRLIGAGNPSLLSRLNQGYLPGALSVLECDIESFFAIEFEKNTLHDFMDPLDYNAPATPARWT